jgi:hypothetical protein
LFETFAARGFTNAWSTSIETGLPDVVTSGMIHPLREFSIACRAEVASVRAQRA